MYLGIMVQMDTIGPVRGTVGGQKWPKMDPKILTISENEKKNEPNSQTRFVFWLVAEALH